MIPRLLCSTLAVVSAATLLAPTDAGATLRRWDSIGHRAMAALAYDRLRPATRMRVDALMRAHPDLANIADGLDPNTADGIRDVFIRSSVWPDRIRGDERFYRENDPRATPTPMLPGYPSMARHEEWHYLVRSFSTDGTPTILLESPNAATAVATLADELANASTRASIRAYNLVWIIHIVGDLHQPMHGTSRSSAATPNGDAGGNRVWTHLPGSGYDSTNLHSVWDGMVGRRVRNVPIDDVARQLRDALPMSPALPYDELRIPDGAALGDAVLGWANESQTLARHVAYALPPRRDGAPPVLDEHYLTLGEAIARQRLALSAYRLAALLEARLGEKP